MTKTIIQHNVETGEIIERPLTADELKQLEIDENAVQAQIDERLNTEAAKESAVAKLSAFGLTVEEIKALGLG